MTRNISKTSQKYSVECNRQVCIFRKRSVSSCQYLLYTYKCTGLHPTRDKVAAIQQAPTPQNSTELRAYLGLLNYYSKFIPNLSIALYKWLQKTTPWQWGTNEDIKLLINQSNCFYLHDFWFILIQVKSSFCVVMPLLMALAQYSLTVHPMAQNSQ